MEQVCQYDQDVRSRNVAQRLLTRLGVGLVVLGLSAGAMAGAVEKLVEADRLITLVDIELLSLQAGDVDGYRRVTENLSLAGEALRLGLAGDKATHRKLAQRWDVARDGLVALAKRWKTGPVAAGVSAMNVADASASHPVVVLSQDAEALSREMKVIPLQALANSGIHAHFTNQIAQLEQRLAEFDLAQVPARLTESIDALSAYLDSASGTSSLTALVQKYSPDSRPVLRVGFGPNQAAAWFKAMKTLMTRTMAEDARGLVLDLEAGRRDKAELLYFRKWVQGTWRDEIAAQIQYVAGRIDRRVDAAVSLADQVIDMTKRRASERKGQSSHDYYVTTRARLQEGIASLETALRVDAILKRTNAPDRDDQRERLQAAKQALEALKRVQ
ncbi:MAG: hypothetical protein ACI9OU_002393 [Candidatus Promineifilaceae bacterium]|jgi:hypothetical protein